MAENQHQRWRLIKTVCLVAAWVSAGMYSSMVGPSIIDLTEIAHCNYEQLAYALTAKNVAFALTAIVAGYLCSRYQHHLELIMGINLIVLGISTAAVPWCNLLLLMAVAMLFQGLTHGMLGVAGNCWVAVMWEGSSSAALHALHFGNAFGAVLAPLVIRPFLSSDSNRTSNMSGSSYNNGTKGSPTRIQIPFGAYGLYTIVWGIVFVYFYIRDKRSTSLNGLYHMVFNRKTSQQQSDTRTFAGVNMSFGVPMTGLLFLFYITISGLYQAIPTYLMPLSVDGDLHFTKSQGNLLIFGYSLCLVSGRLLATILSKRISIHIMYFSEIIISFGLSVLLVYYSFESVTVWWVLVCCFGFFTSPLFPSGIAWCEIYLVIAGPLMAVFFAGGGVGALIFQLLGGYGIDNLGIYFPIYANVGCAAFTLFFYIIFVVSFQWYGKLDRNNDGSPTGNLNKAKETLSDDENTPLIN